MYRSLYWDYGYRRPVSTWNAADVMGKDGLVQHGTVIDVTPDGLVVDFCCVGQRRQLVKYGEAFGHIYRTTDLPPDGNATANLRPGSAVEVLLRQDTNSAWVWRPATLVTGGCTADTPYHQLAMVDLQVAGVGRREVVGYKQVRLPQSPTQLQSRALQQDAFVVTPVCPAPAEIAGLQVHLRLDLHAEQQNIMLCATLCLNGDGLVAHLPLWKVFCQYMSYFYGVWPTSVSGELLLMQRTPGYSGTGGAWTEHEMMDFLRDALHSIDTSVKEGTIWMENGQCYLPSAAGLVEGDERAEGTGWILQDVHHLILVEMLTYLDTMERAIQRRVCRAFCEMISWTISVEIRLTYRKCSLNWWDFCYGCSNHLEHYPTQAPLLKCVTTRTRCIILTNGEQYPLPNVLRTLEICSQLGQCTPGQQVLVMAGHCNVGISKLPIWETMQLLTAPMATGWCKKLLLEQCRMQSRFLELRFSGSVREISPTEDLCRLLECQLPAFDVRQMGVWVAHARHGGLQDRMNICRVLEQFTERDPRASNVYAGYKWTEDNLGALDASKLSRLAQYALSRLAAGLYH